MIFAGQSFLTQEGTTTITMKHKKEIFEFPYTDRSEVIEKGASPIKISTVAIAMTQTLMFELIAHLLNNQPGTLEVGDATYNNTILGEEINLGAISKDKKGRYNIALNFIVLNPTGESSGTSPEPELT